MARIGYDMPTPPPIDNIRTAVHQQVQRADVAPLVRPDQRIAVGVGSRGIGHLSDIVAALVRELRGLGAEPVIIPTMGSHGGATSEGQREVLLRLGVTPERVGAPIESEMETVEVGRAADGTPVRMDRLASQADGIVFVGRIKPHTAFRGAYESGLAKMIAIGLGKQAGAAACHARGFSQMASMVPMLAEVAIASAPIRSGWPCSRMRTTSRSGFWLCPPTASWPMSRRCWTRRRLLCRGSLSSNSMFW
jgi:nickel-dependent lactate racemase